MPARDGLTSGAAQVVLGRGVPDALPVIMVYLLALFAIPSALVVRPLGAAGTPAQIIGVGLLVWWFASQLISGPRLEATNPVKWALLFFGAAMLTSYVGGMSRPTGSAIEVNSSDRAMLSLAAWCGVLLVFSDGLASRDRIERVTRLMVAAATGIAILGFLQFFLGVDLASYVRIPGLSANTSFGNLVDRSGYRRVSGTTSHPIEFGVVLAAVLPLAVHAARFAPDVRRQRAWWVASGVIALALPMSVARSGIIGAAIAVLVLFFTWPKRLRLQIAVAGALGAVAMSALVPGLLGTIKSLFLNVGSDPSTQGRTADYAPVWEYIKERPLFGRGLGTFLPELYRTLDNQLLGLAVETGIVGLGSFAVLILTTIAVALRIRSSHADGRTRDLAMSLVAGIAVVAVNSATFDAFGFSMCAGLLFVLLGLVAALWAQGAHHFPAAPVGWSLRLPFRRETLPMPAWPVRSTIFTVALLFCIGSARNEIAGAAPDYRATATVFLAAPQAPSSSGYEAAGRTSLVASLLHDVMTAPPVRQRLSRDGVEYEMAVADGSLESGTDLVGSGPTLRIRAIGVTPNLADKGLTQVLDETAAQLAAMQAQANVPQPEAITLRQVQRNDASGVRGRPTRALGAYVLLTSLLGAVGWRALGRYRLWLGARRPKDDHPRTSHRASTHATGAPPA